MAPKHHKNYSDLKNQQKVDENKHYWNHPYNPLNKQWSFQTLVMIPKIWHINRNNTLWRLSH
jgi:hypothetical protein